MRPPAKDYLIYGCESCGKRIFAERANQGSLGLCPCCGKQHVVGGSIAKEGKERRRSPRLNDPAAQISLPLLEGELFPLRDLSETGLSFDLAGIPDPRRLTGLAPPPVHEGEIIHIALESNASRTRSYRARVTRVSTTSGSNSYNVGAQFVSLAPEQKEDLRHTVLRLSETA